MAAYQIGLPLSTYNGIDGAFFAWQQVNVNAGDTIDLYIINTGHPYAMLTIIEDGSNIGAGTLVFKENVGGAEYRIMSASFGNGDFTAPFIRTGSERGGSPADHDIQGFWVGQFDALKVEITVTATTAPNSTWRILWKAYR